MVDGEGRDDGALDNDSDIDVDALGDARVPVTKCAKSARVDDDDDKGQGDGKSARPGA